MTEAGDWDRLGRLLIARRVELGWRVRTAFAKAMGLSHDRTFSDIEKVRRTNFDQATLAFIEQSYGWETGSIRDVLAGGDPRPRPVELVTTSRSFVETYGDGPPQPVAPPDDDGSYVADRGPDDPSPGISNEEVVALLKRQRREIDEMLEKLGDGPVEGT